MKIGYARVSTHTQDPRPQYDRLIACGCDEVITEVAGGAATRPKLAALLERLQAGDMLIVVRLDRLGRSLSHVIHMIEDLGRRRVILHSLTENWDLSTPTGRALVAFAAALAEMERELIRERTQEALDARRARGMTVTKPRKLTATQIRQARVLLEGGDSARSVARAFGVHRSTLWRAMREEEQEG